MNRLYQITVTNPCQVGWDQMVPNEQGRHCSACSKTVIDFTNYSDQEIADYFIARNGQGVCGHFKKQQVDRIRIEIPDTILTTRLARWKKFLLICMLVFGTSIFPFEATMSQTLIINTTTEPIKDLPKKKAKKSKKKQSEENFTPTDIIYEHLDGFMVIVPSPPSSLLMLCKGNNPAFTLITDHEKPIIEEENLPANDKTPTPTSNKESQFYILPKTIKTRRSRRKKP